MTEEPQDGGGESPEPPNADLPPPGIPAAFAAAAETAPAAPHFLGSMPQSAEPVAPETPETPETLAPPAESPTLSLTPPDAPGAPSGPGAPAGPSGPGTMFGPTAGVPDAPDLSATAFGPPFGPPGAPDVPVAMVVPADGWRAAAVAVANLSGLGLGFVLIRRWRSAVACWIATALLVLIALPATPGGVPVAVTVIYLLFLVLAAVRGAMRGARTPLSWPPSSQVAFGLAVVLLAVPISGTILFDNARQEATQRMLLGRLAQADAAITAAEGEPATTAEPAYDTALGTYQDLLDHHRTSRAAKLVPTRLAAFYQHVSSPYDSGDYCGAIEPLTFLRSLPSGTISAADLGSLATFPDDRLATSLYECGVNALGGKADPTAAQDLNQLMSTFPTSAQAGKVEPAVAAAISGAAAGLTGADPCGATSTLTGLGTQVKALTSGVASVADALKKDTATDGTDVESGSYACAVSEYKSGKFSDAQSALDSFVSTYPNDPNKALAQKFSIAAQIAQEDSDAGKVTPNLTAGGSVSITISNDSPDPMQILYTGPATGTITIAACTGCKVYASSADGQANACGNDSTSYPKASFTVPPGTLYFLQKSTGTNVRSYAHSEQYDADSIYDVCAFETSVLGDLGGLAG